MTPPKETTIIQPALLPCPFCGNVGIFRSGFTDRRPVGMVNCVQCGASAHRYFQPETEAIAAWNTRAQPAPVEQDEVEQVAMALAKESGVSDWKHVSEHGDYDSRDYWRRLAQAAISTLTPARAEGFKAGDYNYTQLFNAIAAATSPYGGGTGVNVSVKAFLTALKESE